MKSCVFIFLLLQLLQIFANESEDLKVCLKDLGCLQGTHMPGYQEEKFEAFVGIPFAQPPVGDLRFKSPQPVTAWEGVLEATAPKSECIQKMYLLPNWPISGDEDCLYLNLYRPVGRTSNALPVLFYIHAGGFFSGTANPNMMGAEYFMDTKEVILVVTAYRLGPFGFLSTGDENMPGNFGLKDQVMALKWVHDNIAAFGGDPNAVTIFGHSAGGSSVNFHMLSPASKGLFQRAIAMSGNAIASFADTLKEPLKQAVKIAEASEIFNAHELSTADLADTLRSIDAITILNAGDTLKYWFLNPLTNFRPIIEKETISDAFLTECPYKLMKTGKFEHVPWMQGMVSNKGESSVITLSIWQRDTLRQEFNENFDHLLMRMLELPKESPETLKLLVDEYMQGTHELNNATLNGFMELITDILFYYPYYNSVKQYLQYADTQAHPVNLFQFNYLGPNSWTLVYTGHDIKEYGNAHLDDLLYLFRQPGIFPKEYDKNSVDAEVVKAYVGLYVDFAKNGKPACFEKIETCTADSFNAGGEAGICNYLDFVNDGDGFKEVVTNQYNVKRMKMWEQIYANLA